MSSIVVDFVHGRINPRLVNLLIFLEIMNLSIDLSTVEIGDSNSSIFWTTYQMTTIFMQRLQI